MEFNPAERNFEAGIVPRDIYGREIDLSKVTFELVAKGTEKPQAKKHELIENPAFRSRDFG
jgi:hypothetical protein